MHNDDLLNKGSSNVEGIVLQRLLVLGFINSADCSRTCVRRFSKFGDI